MQLTVEILEQKLQAFGEKLERKIEQRLEQKLEQKLDQKLTETKNDIIRWVVGLIFAAMIIMIAIVNFYASAVALITQ